MYLEIFLWSLKNIWEIYRTFCKIPPRSMDFSKRSICFHVQTKDLCRNSLGPTPSSSSREHCAKLYHSISRKCWISYLKFAAAYNGIWWQLWHFQKVQDGSEEGTRARPGIHKNAQSIPLINSYFTNLFGNNSLIFKKYLRDLSQPLRNSSAIYEFFEEIDMFSCGDKGVLQEFRGTNSKLICKGALCKIISWDFPKMLN